MRLNKKLPSVKQRLKLLESMAHPPVISPERLEVIEKTIQELFDKYEIIEKELIKPLQELRSQSK
tara:strand:- start:497 stop:691 length:195 start_codon:yes stop_codon:yes gene_type:complete